MFTKKSISIIFSVLLVAAMISGNASARSLHSASGSFKPLLNSHNFTTRATFDCLLVTEIPQSECEALVALYNSTNGASWTNNTNWLQTNTPCSWYGVECTGHVNGLLLGFNQLSGSIPPQLGNLSQLNRLDLSGNNSGNRLSGNIPSQLGNLTQLQDLYLEGNQLSGNIPPELGKLKQLLDLYLNINQLSGSIPSQLGNLTQLEYLFLSDNQLSGSIPPQLGNLTQLQYFFLGGNQLSGSIPPELGNLTNLKVVNLYSNQLSGSIPSQLGNLTQLQLLYLYGNQLSGRIPPELGNLNQLRDLELYSNQLSGNIPTQLGNLTQLWYKLDLSNNHLSGSVPTQLGNLTQLTILDLSGNQLSGSIPSQLGNLTQLGSNTDTDGGLNLSNNQLSGSVPSQLGNLTKLTELYLDHNPLSGSLPVSLEKLTQLQLFHFNYTNLCEPSDAAFQAWLNGIPGLKGTHLCSVVISGNAGDAGVVLHYYVNGIAKTVTSASNGRYAITVPYGWSGTVTPVKTSVTFTPANRTYTSIATNQTYQNYADIVSFASTASYDGWILESSKGTGKGGSLNSTNTTFQLGDDRQNRQSRAILSFNTISLPNTAVIQSAALEIKQSGSTVGHNPFTVLGTLYADIRTGYFGTSPALELTDFNALATASKIGSFGKTPVSGWYSATLNVTGRNDINKTNLTQLRLYFAMPTNNNNKADYMLFFSGNTVAGSQPQLIISYSLP